MRAGALVFFIVLEVAAAEPPAPADPMLVPVPAAARALHDWNEALDLLWRRSTDMRVATDDLLRAEARSRSALGTLLPLLTANGLASFSLLPPPVAAGEGTATAALYGAAPYQNVGATLTLPLVDAQAWNALHAAKTAEKASQESLSDSRRRLMLGLANTLLGVVASERVSELGRVGLQDALTRNQLAARAEHAGAATALDLTRTRQDVEAARAQVVSGDEALRQAREGLGLALGFPEQVGVTPDFQMDALVAQGLGSCRPLSSAEQRPDLAAARLRVDVARSGVQDVWMQFVPTLGLRSQASYYHIGGVGSFTLWNIQGVLTIPIWDGGIRYGRLREARAQLDVSEAQSLAAQRAVAVELERARRGVEVAEAGRRVADAALAQATEADRLTRRAFEAGQGTSLELVSAASLLRQQQVNLALREYEVVRARVAAILVLAECPEGAR